MQVPIVLLVFMLAVAAALTDDPSEVARECCSSQHLECCTNAFQFIVPLQCANMTVGEHLATIDCAQKAFFGENQMEKLSVRDFPCCEVFAHNENDPDDVCVSRCLSALQSPSLPVARKIGRIHHCRLKIAPLAKCFDRCIAWERTNNTEGTAPFSYSDHCDWTDRLIPGKLYIGPAL